jgi:hypothetical protein
MRQPKSLYLRSLLLAVISFGLGYDGRVNEQEETTTKRTRLAQVSSPNAADTRGGQVRLEIQTQKSLQTPEFLRPRNCTTEEECEEYSGIPKPEPTTKNLKTPFIGLSITSPLN